MATITPSVVNSPKETMTSKGGYLRLTITSITDSDATTNKRYIGCKLTIEGTRWVGLYRWESTLGGQTVSTETRTVENWYSGHVLGTKNLTFDNDSAGNLSLTAYIKHIFYKGSGSWNTSYAKSITETLVCSQLPRYANFTSHSATSTLNTITVSYASDANYGAQQYSLDNGNWTDCSAGSYTLSGFTPGSSHTIKTRIQRSDSGLWTESDQISISLKSLPTSNNVSNVNFNSNGTRVDASISSKDYLSQWYIKIYDGNTLVKDGSSAPNYASSTSDYWTIQNSDNTNMLNRHGSNNSWTLTIKFYVVSNNTTYELSSKTCTCTIPSGSYLPIYNSNNLSYAVQDSESNNITGSNQKVIKGISDVRISTTQASPQGGASMSSYTATCGTKSGTSTSLSNTYIDLSNVDSNSFSVQATDTRGRSTVASKYYSTYIDYFAPYINSGGINISRVDGVTANINISISGKYMNWSGLSTSNTITQVSIQYKLRSSSSWTTLSGFNLSISASSGNFTASGTTTGNVFNISNEYDIKITLKDKLKNVEANGIIYTANVLLWKDLTNHRLGIGKKPAQALDVEGNASISNILYMGSSVNFLNGHDKYIYWKENGYGDKFGISPTFGGYGDDNKLRIMGAIGDAGTDPGMYDLMTISALGGHVWIKGTLTASGLESPQGLELLGTTPYIDFHFNNSSSDYTSRIIEDSSGRLLVSNNLKVGNNLIVDRDIIGKRNFIFQMDALGNGSGRFYRLINIPIANDANACVVNIKGSIGAWVDEKGTIDVQISNRDSLSVYATLLGNINALNNQRLVIFQESNGSHTVYLYCATNFVGSNTLQITWGGFNNAIPTIYTDYSYTTTPGGTNVYSMSSSNIIHLKKITSGTGDPSGGSNGDIYIKYS